jgi:hypothetical protein
LIFTAALASFTAFCAARYWAAADRRSCGTTESLHAESLGL